MKRILMAVAATTFLSAPAMAQSYNTSANEGSLTPLTGAYAGVLGGYSWADTESNLPGIDPDVNGGDYGIFAGYKIDTLLEKTINRTGLGLNGALEVHYVWSDAEGSDGPINFDKNDEFGVSFRPGLSILNGTMPLGLNPYGIIGYRNTEFEASGAGMSVEENFDGFELGIGTELIAYQDFGVRLDYSHTWYEEEGGFDPSEDNVRMGLAYHF